MADIDDSWTEVDDALRALRAAIETTAHATALLAAQTGRLSEASERLAAALAGAQR